MKVVLGIPYWCMCILLSAAVLSNSSGDANELDNSVNSIIGDGLGLTGDDASESEVGHNQPDRGLESRNSSISLVRDYHRILSSVGATPPTAPQDAGTPQSRIPATDQSGIQLSAQGGQLINAIKLVASEQDNESEEITTRISNLQMTQQVVSTAMPNSTAPQSATDGRRVFAPVDPLLKILAAMKTQTTPTTHSPQTTGSLKTFITSTRNIIANDTNTTSKPSAGNRSTEVITVRSSTAIRKTPDVSDHVRHGSRITTPPTKTARQGSLFCGYPPICEQQRCRFLNVSIDRLEKCEVPGAKGGFVFMIVLIALFIIVGNSLLPIMVWRNREMRVPHILMKVSLAAADAVTGFVLLFSVVPNVVRTMGSTEFQLIQMMISTRNSPQAIIAGSMITLSAQASLFHLTYLSIERFVAIRWPLWHRFKAPGSFKVHVAMIWILSLVAAFIPAAFPQSFSFMYQSSLFLFMLTSSGTENSKTVGIVYLVITMAVPFLISVILTAATGIVVWRKMRSTSGMQRYSTRNSRWTERSSTGKGSNGRSRRGTKSDGELTSKELKPEVAVFKTTVIMILAFCITLLPFMTVILLFYAGYYNCLTYTVPYAGAFYACMLNSFINVMIYTVRDRKFREGWKKLLKLSKNRRWMTGTWKSQKTKSSVCASSVQMSQRPGHYRANRESNEEKWERAFVTH